MIVLYRCTGLVHGDNSWVQSSALQAIFDLKLLCRVFWVV